MAGKREKAHRYGLAAEALAAWHLRGKGYRILSQRYRNHQGEIDIVARKGSALVAIEVKARATLQACEETVTPAKQQKIARAAAGLMAAPGKISGLKPGSFDTLRFDVIWIAPGRWPKHIKDAWRL